MQVSTGLSTCISRDLSRKPALCNAPMIRQLLKKGMRDMALTVIKNANLALSFFLELCVLVALGYWGFQTGQGTIAKIGLGIGAPVVAVVVWALFGAPNAPRRLQGPCFLIPHSPFFAPPPAP